MMSNSEEDLKGKELEGCIKKQMLQHGKTREEAKSFCEQQEKSVGESGLGITNREATPLEKCQSLRMDIYGEGAETAFLTCARMFKEPLVKAIILSGDSKKIGEVFHYWDREHSPRWKFWRDARDLDLAQEKKAIKKIRDTIRKTGRYDGREIKYSRDWFTDYDLRPIAERIRSAQLYEWKRKDNSARLNIGDLRGKTRAQILKEQMRTSDSRLTFGNMLGKTRSEILKDQQAEQTPLQRCIKNRVETTGESYSEAKSFCMYYLELK